jgi:hypothetical protein
MLGPEYLDLIPEYYWFVSVLYFWEENYWAEWSLGLFLLLEILCCIC